MTHLNYSWPTFDQMTQQIIKTINPKRILDVGAGGGKYFGLLNEVAPQCEFTALECNETLLPKLVEVGYQEILPIAADGLYGRSSDLYDTVILGDVIEHMRHSDGRDLLEFLNYRARYIIVVTPECMPMISPLFFEGHNSVWRPDAFAWHDYWAHQQCGIMHFYLLRGHNGWDAPQLADVVSIANGQGIFNRFPDGKEQSANLVVHDTRYQEPRDEHSITTYRPL